MIWGLVAASCVLLLAAICIVLFLQNDGLRIQIQCMKRQQAEQTHSEIRYAQRVANEIWRKALADIERTRPWNSSNN